MNRNVQYTFLVFLLLTLLPIGAAENQNQEYCRIATWELHGTSGKDIHLSCEYNGLNYYVERERRITLLGNEYQEVIKRIDQNNNDEMVLKLGIGRTLRSIAANETHLYYISVNWLGSEGLFSYNLSEKTEQTIYEGSFPGRIVYCSDTLLVYETYSGLYSYDGNQIQNILETDQMFRVYAIDDGFVVTSEDVGQYVTTQCKRYSVDNRDITYETVSYGEGVRILYVATNYSLYLLNNRIFYSSSTSTDESVEIACVKNDLGYWDIGAIGDSEFFLIRINDNFSGLSKVLKFEVETLKLINEVVYSGDETFLAMYKHSFLLYDKSIRDKLHYFKCIIV